MKKKQAKRLHFFFFFFNFKAKNILFDYRELQHYLGNCSLPKLEDLWLRMLENGDSCFYQKPKQVFLSSFKILNA